MQYRKFGQLDFQVSALGFGCMRLPSLEGEASEYSTQIDEQEAIRLIRMAIDAGVNYVDTAYIYNQGLSEVVLGKALKDGYREKVKIATKLPVWQAKTQADLWRMLEEELERLQVEYIDMYLLHMLSHMVWPMVEELGVLEFLSDAKAQGKVKHVGFSFHDGFHLFEEIVAAYPWEFCYIQLNYLDEDYQAGLRGVRHAAALGLAVVVMEPLRGGNLVKNVPREVEQLMSEAEVLRTPAEWAFRWVCNHPEVSVVLSGMNSEEQVQENLRIFEDALPESLSSGELAMIERVKAVYERKLKVRCTQCNYCMPCPAGVFIRGIFNFYNNAFLWEQKGDALKFYERMKKAGKDASACVECGRCEERCPQQLPVMRHLQEAHQAFEAGLLE